MANLLTNAAVAITSAKIIAHLGHTVMPKLVVLTEDQKRFIFWLLLAAILPVAFAIAQVSLDLIRKWRNTFALGKWKWPIQKKLEIWFVTEEHYRIPQMILERQLAINRILIRQILDQPDSGQNLKEDVALREYIASSTELEKWWINVTQGEKR